MLFCVSIIVVLCGIFTVASVYATPANNVGNQSGNGNFTLEAFVDEGFTGNSTIINKNTPYLQGPFHDSISSFIIAFEQNQSNGYMIEICEHRSFAGNCIIRGVGQYDVDSIGPLNDQISSIRSLSPTSLELKDIS